MLTEGAADAALVGRGQGAGQSTPLTPQGVRQERHILFLDTKLVVLCDSSHRKSKPPFIQQRLLECKYLKKSLLGGYSEFCCKDFFFSNKLFSEHSLGLSLVSKTVQHAWLYWLRTISLEPSKQVTALFPSGLVRNTMV